MISLQKIIKSFQKYYQKKTSLYIYNLTSERYIPSFFMNKDHQVLNT